MPIEFMNWIKENKTEFEMAFRQNNDGDFNPLQTILELTGDSVTFGFEGSDPSNTKGMSDFKLTFDLSTGLMTKLNIKGIPPGASDQMELSFTIATDISNIQHNTSETTSNNVIHPTPGFEFGFLLIGLVGLVILKKRK